MAPPVHLARGLQCRRQGLCGHDLQGQAVLHAPYDHEPAGRHGRGSQEPLRPGQPPDQPAECHASTELRQSRPGPRNLRVPRRLPVRRQMEGEIQDPRSARPPGTFRGPRRGGAGLGSQGPGVLRRVRPAEFPRGAPDPVRGHAGSDHGPVRRPGPAGRHATAAIGTAPTGLCSVHALRLMPAPRRSRPDVRHASVVAKRAGSIPACRKRGDFVASASPDRVEGGLCRCCLGWKPMPRRAGLSRAF